MAVVNTSCEASSCIMMRRIRHVMSCVTLSPPATALSTHILRSCQVSPGGTGYCWTTAGRHLTHRDRQTTPCSAHSCTLPASTIISCHFHNSVTTGKHNKFKTKYIKYFPLAALLREVKNSNLLKNYKRCNSKIVSYMIKNETFLVIGLQLMWISDIVF